MGEKTMVKIEELLFNDQPITINRKLAKCLGLKEAVIFQQIHYWLEINKKTNNNFINGRYWTYNSIKSWHENEFDFLSLKTVQRTLKSLEDDGLLICGAFNKLKGDKTKWYSIDYDKLIEVCEKRLSEKELLSAKRTEIGKLSKTLKKDNTQSNEKYEDTIRPNWSHGESLDQIGHMVEPNWSKACTKLVKAIPKTSTETSTETSISSSSEVEEEEKTLLENNIQSILRLCQSTNYKLNKTTITNLLTGFGFDKLYKAIAVASSTRSFSSGLIKNYAGYITKILNDQEKVSVTTLNVSSGEKKLKFSNYDQRDTDYDSIEDEFLEWDD